MTRVLLWSFLAIPMALAACAGQTPTPDGSSISVPAAAESTTLAPTTAIMTPIRTPQGTPESTTAIATPTPASSTEMAPSMPTQEPTTATPAPATRSATSLAIAVAPIPADIAEYSRSQWKHWID